MGLLRWKVTGLAVAIVVVVAGGAGFALTRTPAQGAIKDAAAKHPAGAGDGRTTPPPPPVSVVSISPSNQAAGVSGTTPINVVFSAPLAADSPLPTVSPSIPGNWERVDASTLEFVPSIGFTEQTQVQVTVPAGTSGVRSAAGGLLATQVTSGYTTGSYDITRAQQLLAQLGYLPLDWAPAPGSAPPPAADASGQLSAAYDPPAGTFVWQSGWPSQLQALWSPGQPSQVLTGAVMAFEYDRDLSMDGSIGPKVWAALLSAVAAGQDNTHGYSYALASQVSPETLTVWHNGTVVLHALANTGIPAAPTTVGTAPVYLRYQNQVMRGTNPDGTPYADPVSWVAYFRSGEAVHYFPRDSYGYPQSLGCVELPYDQAKSVWPYLWYGTLVTVTAA